MLSHFFNITPYVLLACVFTGQVLATDDKWLIESNKIINKANKTKDLPSWLQPPSEDELSIAKEISEKSQSIQKKAFAEKVKELEKDSSIDVKIAKGDGMSPGGTVYLYISFSMPDSEIKAVIEEASNANAIVVLRGIKKGTNIKDTSLLLARLSNKVTPRPEVVIDPRPFQKYGVTVAPAMTLVREDKPALQARGIYSSKWIKERAESDPENIDLGQWGTTYPIVEIDLIEDMKSRVAAIDWDEKKKNAYKDYWKKASFIELPNAQEDNEYEFDPTVTVSKDIVGTTGEILAHKGQRFNPLDMLPFTKTVFVFDSTNKKQVEYVKEQTDSLKAQSRAYILITTRVDANKGWKAFEKIEELYQRPVYLLNKQLKNRFSIDKVPTIITATGRVFTIKEKKL